MFETRSNIHLLLKKKIQRAENTLFTLFIVAFDDIISSKVSLRCVTFIYLVINHVNICFYTFVFNISAKYLLFYRKRLLERDFLNNIYEMMPLHFFFL